VIRSTAPTPKTGFAAPVKNACTRAAVSTDRFIDRHRRVRAVAEFDIREFAKGRYRGPWRWIVFAILAAIVVAVVALVATAQISDLYLWIRQHDPFPGDRYYTEVMRDHPWVYLVGGGLVFVVLLLVLPRRLWLNELIVTMGSGAAGFVGGHVFW
jgi:hypothetical protein